jgi:AraC-like DNA-binding protein
MAYHVAPLGLRTWGGAPGTMSSPHLHADVEINLISSGSLDYLIGGRALRVEPGCLTVFWAAIPHQIVAVRGVARMWWVTVGLRELLSWRLPPALVEALFAGEAVVAGADEADRLHCERWYVEWERGEAWRAQIGAEVAVRLGRLALEWGARRPPRDGRGSDAHGAILARVARHVAEHYLEPIGVADIARAAGVHPKYLSAAFSRASGMGVQHYLTRMRLGHAQHLLRATRRSVTDIALGSGFGSLNAFYSAFRRHVGQPPERFRAGEPTRSGL